MKEQKREYEYETRATAELFGAPAGFVGHINNIDVMYKVADEYEEFVATLQARGLGVSDSPWPSGDRFGIIMNGEEGLDFPFHYFQKEHEKGVWISDIAWYERLMKVEK